MISLEFEIEGDKQLIRKLRGIETSCKNFKPEFDKTGTLMTAYFGGEVFISKGAVIGEPWKSRQHEERYTNPLLQRTGKMRGGFKYKANPMLVNVFNLADYFKFHQSKMPRTTLLPRRIMMKLNEHLKTRIVKIFHEGLVKRLKAKG